MALAETVILTIGVAIGKGLVKRYVGDDVLATVLPALLDLAKGRGEKGLARREDARLIEELGDKVAEGMVPFINVEARQLGKKERDAVMLEVARALAKANPDARMVLEARADPQRLTERILMEAPDTVKLLSATEEMVYRKMVGELSRQVVRVVPRLEDFAQTSVLLPLEIQDRIWEALQHLVQQPKRVAERFEHQFRNEVAAMLDRMEPFGLPTLDPKYRYQSLSISYISLQVDPPARDSIEAEVEGDESFSKHFPVIFGRVPPIRSVDQLMNFTRRIVVRGDAGSGKTTLLQWLAVRAAKRDFVPALVSWDDSVPFFIRLRALMERQFPIPDEFPGLVVPHIAGNTPQGWVHEQLENGRAVILIDGVDELPQGQREAMLEALSALVRTFPLARYIISSRPSALNAEEWPQWHEWTKREGFHEVTLRPMAREQIEEFVDHWHNAVSRLLENNGHQVEAQETRTLPGQLKTQLRSQPGLRRLAANPLLCAVICALHRERKGNLPPHRTALYKDCTEMLLEERERVRGVMLPEYPDLSKEQKTLLVQRFALWLMRNDHSEIETERADEYFGRLLKGLHGLRQPTTGGRVRAYFVERTNILRAPTKDRIDFHHKTFQEYLAAQAILEDDGLDELLGHALDDPWRETIVLAAGLARQRERERLLKTLVDRGVAEPENRHSLHLLALACLETARVGFLDPAVETHVMQAVRHLFPPKDYDDAKILAKAGDPAVPLLAMTPNHAAPVIGRCLAALHMIGSLAALNTVAGYAHLESESVYRAIGQMWSDFDHRTFGEMVVAHTHGLWLSRSVTEKDSIYFRVLTELLIQNTPRQNLLPLVNASGLKSLVIGPPIVGDLTPLERLTQLQRLSLRGQSIRDLAPIAGLTQLQDLSLHDTSIHDLTPLTGLPQLQLLVLESAGTRDLSPLANLSNLRLLRLRSSSMRDLTPLTGLTWLRHLSLNGADIDDLTPLAGLTWLESLNLSGANIRDLTPLAGLTRLELLRLHNTGARDLTPLARLRHLDQVELAEGEKPSWYTIPANLESKVYEQFLE